MPKIDTDLDSIVFSNSTGTDTLQGAIDLAISTKKPLFIAPGTYTVANLAISDSVTIYAAKGTVTLRSSGMNALYLTVASAAAGARIADVVIQGLTLDGENKAFSTADRPALIRAQNVDRLVVEDCFFWCSQKDGINLNAVSGRISGNELLSCRTSIYAFNSVGLTVEANYVRDSLDIGIAVWRSSGGFDGTVVHRNRVYGVDNNSGGSGQYGNAISCFRAHNVTVSDNVVMNCNYSGVRFNTCTNSHITGNQIFNARECAIFVESPDPSEPAYEGVVVSGNTIYNAGEGMKIANPGQGGRRATVHGNNVSFVNTKMFDEWGLPGKDPAQRYTRVTNACGIITNIDSVVDANVVENCAVAGIVINPSGTWDPNTRSRPDQNTVLGLAAGNAIKNCPIGIGYNDYDNRAFISIAENMISGATNGSVVLVEITDLTGGPLQPGNGFGPYVRVSGSSDKGGLTTPAADRTTFSRNKVVPKAV